MTGSTVRKIKACTAAMLMVCLVPCLAPGTGVAAQKAVVQTTQADWSGAAHAVVDVNPAGGPRSKQVDVFPTATSDWIIRSYGDYFYLIGRYMADSLTRFHIDTPTVPDYQVSVLPDGVNSANPHDMIFVNANKAYMPMYELTTCWIVNPQNGEKIGELDLSQYANGADGVPEMHAGVIVDGKLFLVMQRLVDWEPAVNAYVAVFDVATDQEIDTTGGAEPNGLKGIEIPGRNPATIQYLPENDTIYVGCVGKYPGFDAESPYLYTGGIVTVDPDTYAATLLVDDGPDGPEGDHPYGAIAGAYVVSPSKGYFIGYVGWGDNNLHTFNPTTGAVEADTVEALDGKSLSPNESGAAVDENGLLWISSTMDAKVYIVDPADDSVDEAVGTNLNPGTIAFCPPTIWPGPPEEENTTKQVHAPTGSGAMKVEIASGVLSDVVAKAAADYTEAANKPDKQFVDGLVGFTINGLAPGAAVDVTVTFPTTRTADAAYYKINAAGDFVLFDSYNYTLVDGNTVVLRLVDGDAFDLDPAPGVIRDPGGWAMTPAATPASTNTGTASSDGDSGCFINALTRPRTR
ncbi:MAG: choice-of-anchor U domain-containing protein [Desulfatibacillaceae bacterium]